MILTQKFLARERTSVRGTAILGVRTGPKGVARCPNGGAGQGACPAPKGFDLLVSLRDSDPLELSNSRISTQQQLPFLQSGTASHRSAPSACLGPSLSIGFAIAQLWRATAAEL